MGGRGYHGARGGRIRHDAFCRDVCAALDRRAVAQTCQKRHVRASPPHAKPHQRRKNVAHGASRGITAHREHAEPRSGDRRSAIIKTSLSPLPGLLRRIGPAFSPRLSPWATFLRPPQRAPEPDRAYSCAYAPRGWPPSRRATLVPTPSTLGRGTSFRRGDCEGRPHGHCRE